MSTPAPSTPAASGRALRRWHRALAPVALLAVAAFALTGLLHPLMTRVQPRPVQMQPLAAPPLPESFPAPAEALRAAGVARVQALRLAHDGQHWRWRAVADDGGVHWLSATDGQVLPGAEAQQAERLARHYTGAREAVRSIAPVTAFDADYSYVQRLLPVWRVCFDRPDGLCTQVSTEEDRLAGLSNHRQRFLQRWFYATHRWAWLPWPARGWWINLLLAGLVAAALLGLWLSVRRSAPSHAPRAWTRRAVHRRLGVATGLAVLAWATSGFVQARQAPQQERADSPRRVFVLPVTDLRAAVVPPPGARSGAQLVVLAAAPVWRWPQRPPESVTGRGLAMSEHAHRPPAPAPVVSADYRHALDGTALADGEAMHRNELAAYFGVGAEARGDPQLVAGFTPEYGFLFKRLPVWRLAETGGAERAWFLDLSSERLAAVVDAGDRRAGAFFAYAHKWEFLTPVVGKNGRDAISALFALLLLAAALVGAWLWARRR